MGFVVGGAEVAQARVPAAGVVEALDVPEQAHPGVFADREPLPAEQLFLEAREERLGDRVVPWVADRSGDKSMPEPLA
jgi:hypothetical protein